MVRIRCKLRESGELIFPRFPLKPLAPMTMEGPFTRTVISNV
jgi:hypothetical protein